MIGSDHVDQQICPIHNLSQEFLNPDKSNNVQLYACNQCQQIKQSNQKIIQQYDQQLNQNSNIWSILIHSLVQLREAFIKSIKNIESMVDQIRNQIQQNNAEFKNLNLKQLKEIKIAHDNYLKNQVVHQRSIIQLIETLKQISLIESLIQTLNQINLQKLNYDQKEKINLLKQQKDQLKVMRYEYELIPDSSIIQQQNCDSLAFNYDGSIIIAACEKIIKIFEFKNKYLKEIQQLENHESRVTCLLFMRKRNQFISGSNGGSILVWQLNTQDQWVNLQVLSQHSYIVECFIINKNEDMIISGSYDQSIIFWKLGEKQWQFDQQIQCQSPVWSLSLNDSNIKLLSCEDDQIIQVFLFQGKKWKIQQIIQVEVEGLRLGFIKDDQFVFWPWHGNQLYFYKFDQQSNQFQKYQELQLSNSEIDSRGFPIKFIDSKNLLIVKNSRFINILRRQGNENFIQDQSIEFKSQYLFGDITQNGDFMVTWDQQTLKYQVRQLKEVE